MRGTRGTHPIREGLRLLDGGWYADDPHEVWTWMRREAPVYHDAVGDVWGITRYDDVLAIEKDPRTFSSRRAPRPHGMPLPMMISMDDPDHRRRRSLVNRGFTPRRIGEMEDTVAGLCRRIVDRVAEAGTCDFVWDVAAPLPLMMIADLLGFAEERARRPAALVRRHAAGTAADRAPRGRSNRPPTPWSASASCSCGSSPSGGPTPATT